MGYPADAGQNIENKRVIGKIFRNKELALLPRGGFRLPEVGFNLMDISILTVERGISGGEPGRIQLQENELEGWRHFVLDSQRMWKRL
ncbi:MAG TPA: hypothetical protein VMD99_11625 [Terriglobales bacterium]|nr:hypothetical protein [Terriglobales bacterium]